MSLVFVCLGPAPVDKVLSRVLRVLWTVNGKNFYPMNFRSLWGSSYTEEEEEEVFLLLLGAPWGYGVGRSWGILRLPEPQQW